MILLKGKKQVNQLKMVQLEGDDSDEDDKERLAELSKQLNENMSLAKGQKENAKFKMQEGTAYDDGETPINTQEVFFYLFYFNLFVEWRL